MSEEIKQKVSQTMKKFCKEHPDRVPYVLNHSSKESYPEKYFRELLINLIFASIQDHSSICL